MRELKIIEHISRDGVIQIADEDGNFPYGDWKPTAYLTYNKPTRQYAGYVKTSEALAP